MGYDFLLALSYLTTSCPD